MTQLDDETVEVKFVVRMNFGGSLPKPIVYGVIIPNFNRIVSHFQVFCINSIELAALTKTRRQTLRRSTRQSDQDGAEDRGLGEAR